LWRLNGVEPIAATYPETAERSIELGMSFVGSPSTVRTKLSAAVKEAGVNYLMLRFAFGDMAPQEALHSLELFATEVRPSLAAQEPR
jgi:alkanesulfonate monooxygenase SsuD/methylene tetrahydromethanopterin reductase-like flavin-dependent oxidoreductase (luciferase family)